MTDEIRVDLLVTMDQRGGGATVTRLTSSGLRQVEEAAKEAGSSLRVRGNPSPNGGE